MKFGMHVKSIKNTYFRGLLSLSGWVVEIYKTWTRYCSIWATKYGLLRHDAYCLDRTYTFSGAQSWVGAQDLEYYEV